MGRDGNLRVMPPRVYEFPIHGCASLPHLWRGGRSVHPDLCAERNHVIGPDPVDRFVAHAYAPVRSGIGWHVGISVDGISTVEELRAPELAERVRDKPVNLPVDVEYTNRCRSDRRCPIFDVGVAEGFIAASSARWSLVTRASGHSCRPERQ